jgi:membrane-associated phospholipid phosphatase
MLDIAWFNGVLVASTAIIPIVTLALWGMHPVKSRRIYLFFIFFYFVVVDVGNDFLKRWFRRQLGRESPLGKRPNSCGNGRPGKEGTFPVKGAKCVGCSKFPKGRRSRSYGLPSGHSQELVFTATFWTLYLIQQNLVSQQWGVIFLLWVSAILVMVQRWLSGCHTKLQIQLGGSLGIITGLLAFFIGRQFFLE